MKNGRGRTHLRELAQEEGDDDIAGDRRWLAIIVMMMPWYLVDRFNLKASSNYIIGSGEERERGISGNGTRAVHEAVTQAKLSVSWVDDECLGFTPRSRECASHDVLDTCVVVIYKYDKKYTVHRASVDPSHCQHISTATMHSMRSIRLKFRS